MPLDLSSVGTTTEPSLFTYDWKAVALYALGIGARRDELDYVFDGRGPKVYPTFAVVPALPVVTACLARTQGDIAMVVHGGQTVRAHAPLPPEGTLVTTGTIAAIYDLRKMAQVVIEARTCLQGQSEPVVETTWSIIFRGAGGFGGSPAPTRADADAPRERPADFHVEQATSPEQALLYRLSGDLNPLHADPAFAAMVGFPQGPILHGLCTYGFAARAVIGAACDGDASRLRVFEGQFRKPVWPGETLVTEGWKLDGGRYAVVTRVKERGDAVLSSAYAEIA